MSAPLQVPSTRKATSSPPPDMQGAQPMSISPDFSLAQTHTIEAALNHGGPQTGHTQVASAASMLRAASAMAATASSGAEGLQAVSSALLSQAKAQALADGIAQAADSNQHPITAVVANATSDSAHAPSMARQPSDSVQYSAAMSARIASVLQSGTRAAVENNHPAPLVSPPISGQQAAQSTAVAVAQAEAQMGQIAARAAVQEAESQLRAQAILRSAVSSAPQMTGSLAQRRGSATGGTDTSVNPASAPPSSSKSPSFPLATSNISASEYLKQLGLSHIAMPSIGLEQSWGSPSTDRSQNSWNAVNPAMGFSLSGVPSMPLMPTPPLQMLPPPPSPSFKRHRLRGKPLQDPRFSQYGQHGQQEVSATEAVPNVMSPFPYPFQVVQTPGGTARAGWWVPPSEVPTERRKKAKVLDQGPSQAAQSTHDQGPASATEEDPDSDLPFFQPSYRDFTLEEYSALASAAAYATAALTSTSAPPQRSGLDPSDSGNASWRPLSALEQESIATQLRAWAGLEGPDKQAEARQALEERQVHIISQATQAPLPAAPNHKADSLVEPSNAAQFFPPDFASHYRTQLQALTEGYYARLHSEALHKGQWAGDAADRGPRTSGSLSSLNIQAVHTANEQRRESAARSAHSDQPGQHQRRSTLQNATTPMSPTQVVNSMAPPVSTPELGPGAQDPVQLLSAASNAAGQAVNSPEVRDRLLHYAHGLYSTGNQNAKPDAKGVERLHPSLLPLLHTLHKLHPEHLPTLLLLSCAYYAADNYAGSLWYNNLILQIDPNYVESMSNIGTTLRALGRWKEAESWWWRAIKLRPGYWDAYENLLGVMCSPTTKGGEKPKPNEQAETVGPRFQDALRLCEFVETHVLGKDYIAASGETQSLPPHLPVTQVPRLQNLYYAKGNLKYVLPQLGTVPAAQEYQKAIEVALSPSKKNRYSLRDLVVATCVVGMLSMGAMLPGSAAAAAALQVSLALGLNPTDPNQAALISTGMFSALFPGGGILALVRNSGPNIINTLLRLGNGQLPMIMLVPEAAMQLNKILFAETAGGLPSLFSDGRSDRPVNAEGLKQAQKQAAQTSSTIMLTLAKLFQDSTANPVPGPHGLLTLGGIPPSISMLLPLYYLSIALNPSASTFNNLGILLSSIPIVTTVVNAAGQHQQLNGQALAMQYYTQGLQLDPKHPHIYTNLGSLLKDLGHLNEAIKMYEKAVEFNPTFDVALANLGNAIKDQGRTQDSVVYYRRAVQVNPKFPEALCGLVNALLAVCDWKEVYSGSADKPGWMSNVSELVTKQLRDGCHYGAGAFQSEGQQADWIGLIVRAYGDQRAGAANLWATRLRPFFEPLDRVSSSYNEGGFAIRIFEKLMRRTQRSWYLDVFGKRQVAPSELGRIQASTADVQRYPKAKLPSCLVTPAVPTVLPFHTFTYPLSPRQIRLICHRNALRVSQGTLSQVWLPSHVYPPPSPPSPKINIGYVSSDFNNHPLAHLMESVFGFHDLSRFNIFLYATTASDNSPYRQKIEREAQHFLDVSTWSNQQIVERIVSDNVHVLMNLNGYTKGARNEVFAARPCPVQMEFMGFAGSMASGWTDWIVADPVVCPPEITSVERWRKQNREPRPTDLGADLDPEEPSDEWVYSDRFIYMPHSYFVNDHAQGFREAAVQTQTQKLSEEESWKEEEQKRYAMRKELFPNLPDDYVIFADFNQLYKCDPMLFKLWLRILKRVPKSILWLLCFPASGEPHLLQEAREYAGDEVASRVIFTDVAPKHIHIHRGRIADLFLDTTECNAHTTAADILWSGTPVLTWPRHLHKMCSRVAASIVRATGFGAQMEVDSEQAYEDRAVELANSVAYTYVDAGGKTLPAVEPDTSAPPRTAEILEADATSVAAQPHSAPTASVSADGRSQGAPAPAGVAAQASATSQTGRLGDSLRASVRLPPSPPTPAGAVSRRGQGELVDLRRSLFLGRDTSPLFDTRLWVRDLEKGYAEAWRRWVEGTDTEDSAEWEALPSTAAEKRSGHIWVADL